MKHSGIILLLILLFSLEVTSPPKGLSKRMIDQKVTPIVILLDSIHQEIINLELLYPEIVYQQVLHESNNLTSSLFISNNNLFGMKVSGNRATTSNKIIKGFKWYKNWRESLLDYALYQMAFCRVSTKEAYYNLLQKSYASDSMYLQKLKKY